MKSFFKAYGSFSRTERFGIYALISLLLLLITAKATMRFWIIPDRDLAAEQRLKMLSEELDKNNVSYKIQTTDTERLTNHPVPERGSTTSVKKADNSTVVVAAKLFYFDPNTIDSAGLRRLGLKEKTAAIFLHWRSKGKVFRKKEEFKGVYTLSEEEYNRLAPYIRIKGAETRVE